MKFSSVVLLLMNLSLASSWSLNSTLSSNASDWTPSAQNCSAQEIMIMRKLFIGVAAHTGCANESTVDKYEIHVESECASLCTPALQNLEESLPDCNYFLEGYENSNKKSDAFNSLAHCNQGNSTEPVSILFHSNSTISIRTPSSASGSAVMDEVSASSNSGSQFVGSSRASRSQITWIGPGIVALGFLHFY